MERSASAIWTGDLKNGKGNISTQSGILNNAQYGFNTRFENGPGTNPEELIAAAHAGCFTMALSNELSKAGFTVEKLETNAVVTLDKDDGGFSVTSSRLTLVATITGGDKEKFGEIANSAKENCPISKLLNAEVTLDAKLTN